MSKLLDVDGLTRKVLILQASMPVGVLNYLFAQRYARSPEQVASLVLVSTLLSVISIPCCRTGFEEHALRDGSEPIERKLALVSEAAATTLRSSPDAIIAFLNHVDHLLVGRDDTDFEIATPFPFGA